MFGLEKQKKKPEYQEFIFELEKEFKNPAKAKEYKQKIEQRIQQVKDILRSGGNQDEFNRFGLLLHGYTSLIKVMSRFEKKK